MDEAVLFLEEENREVKHLYKNYCHAEWNSLMHGKKEDYEAVSQHEVKYKEHFNSKERFEKVKSLLKTVKDPLEKRQLDLLYNEYLACQGDLELIKKIAKASSEINHKFNTFRANLDGKEVTDNEIKTILKEETDSDARKRAWEASKKQGEHIEKDLLELIKLRNILAQSLGFENYYVMSLELSEQKEEEIERIFLELEKETLGFFEKLKGEVDEVLSKRYGIQKDEMKPWHYHDLFFQEAPKIHESDLDEVYNLDVVEVSRKFYEEIGLDVDEILKNSDLYERPGKYQHACCLSLDKSGDIRIMENVKNDGYWMGTTLHELGHAVYEKSTDDKLPFFLRENAHIFITEAIALLFERISKNISFIKKYGNKVSHDIEKIGQEARNQNILNELVFMMWAQVMFHFERQLYRNPEQDLNKLWWDLIKKYQLIDFSRDKPDWASKTHISSAPAYYHNYVLGKLLASQLNNIISVDILKSNIISPDYSNPQVGEFLVNNLFIHGKKYRWDIAVEKAVGEHLMAKYFVKEFCS